VNARGAIDAHVPVSGRSLLSPQQRRINGLLIMLLFALIAFTLNVRQRLRVN
jgi:apolipoprotein N-acyltransferase